ncbi:MAG TPA: ABC transporter ATP-binding protein [Thermoanaerobaculia bacterium]|nr:ABC transporter ATP-binding protein [Thermoanaerobaculia bacterium]
MSAPPILRGEGLAKAYRLGEQRVEALAGLDIVFSAGEFTALEGPSGSGKTTLLNVLGLLDRPDAGTLALDGEDAARLDERARSRVRLERFGFVFQTFNLIPVLSARENVEYPMALAGVARAEREERALGLLASVGIAEKRDVRPDLLSGGQRQRVAIARALANAPEIVFADEPTANLDSHTAADILDLMRRLNGEHGVAFLFATHDPRVVERARRVVTIRDGRIVAER